MKKILYVLTGGTIASQQTAAGLAPSVMTGELSALLDSYPVNFQSEIAVLFNRDSSEMGPREWARLAELLGEKMDHYDGFVVLHGTDTLGYASAMLTYMLGGSGKPIVLTGSQLPLAVLGSDGYGNLQVATAYALDEQSRGIVIAFAGEVLAGTHAVKIHTSKPAGFTSIDLPALATVDGWQVQHRHRLPETKKRALKTAFDPRVLNLPLVPGWSPKDMLEAARGFKAVILGGFGMGGLPQGFKDALNALAKEGVLVLLHSQVRYGGPRFNVYAVGQVEEEDGILPVEGMVLEALVMKTMWALGQAEDLCQVKELLKTPVAWDILPPALTEA